MKDAQLKMQNEERFGLIPMVVVSPFGILHWQ